MPTRRNSNESVVWAPPRRMSEEDRQRIRRAMGSMKRLSRSIRGKSKSINDLESQGNRIANEIKVAYDKAKSEGNKARMKQLHKRLVNVYKNLDKYAMNTRGYIMEKTVGVSGKADFPLSKDVRTDNNNAAKWLGKGFARELRNEGIRAAKQDAANLLGAKVLNEG